LRREDEFHSGGLPVVVLFEPLGEADDIGTCRPGPKGEVALLFMVGSLMAVKTTILMLACRCSLVISKKYTRLS
jgi:hypothetical protein